MSLYNRFRFGTKQTVSLQVLSSRCSPASSILWTGTRVPRMQLYGPFSGLLGLVNHCATFYWQSYHASHSRSLRVPIKSGRNCVLCQKREKDPTISGNQPQDWFHVSQMTVKSAILFSFLLLKWFWQLILHTNCTCF